MEIKDRIDAELAGQDFDRMVDRYRIDLTTEGLDDAEKRDIEHKRARVVSMIQAGRLEIDEQGIAVYNPIEGDPLRFDRFKAYALTAMDQRRENHTMAKLFTGMAAMSGVHYKRIEGLDAGDAKDLILLASLFLAL